LDDEVSGGSEGAIPICLSMGWVAGVEVVEDVAAKEVGEFLDEAL
jgi:hypothetical protein